jgi:hypothetical protein
LFFFSLKFAVQKQLPPHFYLNPEYPRFLCIIWKKRWNTQLPFPLFARSSISPHSAVVFIHPLARNSISSFLYGSTALTSHLHWKRVQISFGFYFIKSSTNNIIEEKICFFFQFFLECCSWWMKLRNYGIQYDFKFCLHCVTGTRCFLIRIEEWIVVCARRTKVCRHESGLLMMWSGYWFMEGLRP